MPVQSDKPRLRALALSRLDAMTPDERAGASAAICERLVACRAFSSAQHVCVYLPTPEEADLQAAVEHAWRDGKTVAAPDIDWDARAMRARVFECWSDLVPARHGLRAPPRDAPELTPDSLDLVITPGLAFDRDGGRLGRGGGFYDRFLTKAPKSSGRIIGVCFGRQLFDASEPIPMAPHDRRVDAVITETGVFGPRAEECA